MTYLTKTKETKTPFLRLKATGTLKNIKTVSYEDTTIKLH